MEIKELCRSRGFFLHPDSKKELRKIDNPGQVIEEILDSISSEETVILPTHIKEFFEENGSDENKFGDPSSKDYSEKNRFNSFDYEIERDVTDKSNCCGDLSDFVDYFNDKFEKLSNELRKRNGIKNTRPIESLDNFDGKTSIIGIVKDIRETSNGHRLIKLEDTSGETPALALKNDEEIFSKSQRILLDEVIGLQGNVGKDSDFLIIDNIVWPDIPVKNEPNRANEEVFAAFISDIHFGSETFLEDAWDRFIKWINGEMGGSKHKELANKTRYLVVAGDIVEGVGVYPGQKEELAIQSIEKQYEKAAKEINRIRDDVKIFLSPGNHDAVRQAEPQPALCEEMRKPFGEKENIEFIGNPCVINLHKVNTLIYHGRSLDDLVAELPNKRYEEPADVMTEYIRRRHLVPIFGKKTPIAPEKQDYLFVDKPDIIHSGHIHTVGIDRYRGINLLNTGTWQGQTKFQRKKGIEPTPGRIVLFDLKNHEPKILKFH